MKKGSRKEETAKHSSNLGGFVGSGKLWTRPVAAWRRGQCWGSWAGVRAGV